MPLTIVAPARLPEALLERAAAPLSLPNLEALLASSTVEAGPPVHCAVCDALGVASSDGSADPPIAALRLAAETESRWSVEARDGYWLCADPIATTLGLDSVRVDATVDDLTIGESSAIVGALDDFFRVDGLRFVAPAPSRWYVRAATPQSMSAHPVDDVVGRSMMARMPSGRDSAAWIGRLNEAQMLLHTHRVNALREQRGARPVSSCWWWGGGSWPGFSPARVGAVANPPPWARVACRENGVAIDERTELDAMAGAMSGPGSGTATLIFVDAPDMPSAADAWRAIDARAFARLGDARRRDASDPWSIVLPWIDGTLRIDIPATKPAARWQRWLSPRAAPSPPVRAALEQYL